MGKAIVVTSGKGGTGKTTTSAELGSCLAALGYKTLCVDCDSGLKNLDIALCMADYAVSDFTDLLDKTVELEEAVYASPHIENLFLLSAPAQTAPEDIDPDKFKALARELKAEFDYVFFDAPSGVGAGLRLAASDADMAIVVATADNACLRDASVTVSRLRGIGINEIRLLINRVSLRQYRKIYTTLDDVIDVIGAQLIGVIAEDDSLFYAQHDNLPLILRDKRRAAYHYLDTARRITGADIPLRRRFMSR